MGPGSGKDERDWERDVLERVVFAQMKEQRRARRWGNFFRLLFFAYLVAVLVLYWPNDVLDRISGEKHTAVVDIEGLIAEHAPAGAASVIKGLRAAFDDERTKGVIVRINSPGGSPVQAGAIYEEIKRQREKHADIPIYAVITDVCASGGYYVAVAADKVYADRSSLVGSIGVRMDSFGFVEAMQKLGIERRLLTAGEHKGILDPFLPTNPEEVEHVEGILASIHGQFIDRVRQGRGERLSTDPKLFSGLFWTGAQGQELGLVDELAGADHVAREVIGADKLVNFTRKPDYLERLTERFGVAVGRGVAASFTTPLGVQ
jgi:protease-4